MPIVASDIKYRLSGGAANTNPNLALGGAMSTAGGGIITTDVINNVWDNVAGAESSAGDTEYRCIYVRNEHGTLSLTTAKVWISSNTTSSDDEVDIALGGEGKNGTAETVANENTAPIGESFTHPTTFAGGLSLTDLAPNDFYPVWIRRTVNSSAAAFNADAYTLSVQGETLA